MLKPVKQIVFYPIEFLFFASLWLLLTEFSWNQFLFAVIFSILDCAILVRLLIKPLSFKSFKALVFLIFYVIFDSIKSHFYIFPCHFHTIGKAMNHTTHLLGMQCLHHIHRIFCCISAMNDQRFL